MRRFTFLGFVVSILVLAGASGPGRAEEREGWRRVEAVPAWVGAPPTRPGYFRFVDAAQSNLLRLAYPDTDTPTAGRNVRLLVQARLTPLMGTGARAPAEAAAGSARAVEQAFVFQPAERGREEVVGATLYTVFVLWEVPSAPLLAAVPAEKRPSVEAALLASPRGSAVPWTTLPGEPAWAFDPPVAEGRLCVATKHASGSWDVVSALAVLRGGSALRSEVQGRLRPVVGNDIAFEVGVMVGGSGGLLERVRIAGRAEGWQLWDVGYDEVLACVPAAWRTAARAALAGPRPPSPWSWDESVLSEPGWVAAPTGWPDHVPVVQVRHGDTPDATHRIAAKRGEQDVAEILEARLTPAVGAAAARRGAEAGARRRQLVRKATRAVTADGAAESGVGPVTAWTLWQVPLTTLLEALPEAKREAARAALLED